MNLQPTIICVDFDGTIVDHDYPQIGQPVPLALDWLRTLNTLNFEIILFTMRSGKELDEAVEYLEENGIQLFGINTNPNQKDWTDSPKAYGHMYIDDAAIGCPLINVEGFKRMCVDWIEVGRIVTNGGVINGQ